MCNLNNAFISNPTIFKIEIFVVSEIKMINVVFMIRTIFNVFWARHKIEDLGNTNSLIVTYRMKNQWKRKRSMVSTISTRRSDTIFYARETAPVLIDNRLASMCASGLSGTLHFPCASTCRCEKIAQDGVAQKHDRTTQDIFPSFFFLHTFSFPYNISISSLLSYR